MNHKKIVVTSRSFSAHPKLREELLALFPNTKFNDEGIIVDEKTLAEFFSMHLLYLCMSLYYVCDFLHYHSI